MYKIEGKTDKEVEDVINSVISKLASRFAFSFHTVKDIKQECWIFALSVLHKYDVNRPLENFLYRHMYYRLINFKRDTFRRPNCPCSLCKEALDGYTRHEDGRYCKKFLRWYRRNLTISNISGAMSIENVDDRNERAIASHVFDSCSMEVEEVLSKIDEKLPVSMRQNYLQMKSGIKIPRLKRLEIENEIARILKEEGVEICQPRKRKS